MLPENEKKLLELCQQAMNEDDANKLLEIFLALDQAARVGTTAERILSGEPLIEADRVRKSKPEQRVVFEA